MKEFKVIRVTKNDWSWKQLPDREYALYYKGDYISDEYIFNSELLFDKFEETLNKYTLEGWMPESNIQFKDREHIIQVMSREKNFLNIFQEVYLK